ncbi:unnamed protein product [Clavelina lepadiformis]|uniref:Protein kinase domain-containing protein n=1 Tax=Clavelina lepadiformis TaxID=159417 RepID=A0ABP0FK17_CLALP
MMNINIDEIAEPDGDPPVRRRQPDGNPPIRPVGPRQVDKAAARPQEAERRDAANIDLWNMRMNFEGKPAVIATGGLVAVGAYVVIRIVNNPSSLDRVFNYFERSCHCVLQRIGAGSLMIQLVTEGEDAQKEFLDAYFSNKMLSAIREIFEQELDLTVGDLTLERVGKVEGSRQDFDEIMEEAKLNLKNSSYLQTKSEIVLAQHQILEDESRILARTIPQKTDKQSTLDTIKKLQEDWKAKQLFAVYNAHEFLTSPDNSDLIRRGSFSILRNCFHKKLGKVAVECATNNYALNSVSDAKKVEMARDLSGLRHRNIVRILGITWWQDSVGIIWELVEGGSLHDLLMSDAVEDVPWASRFRIVKEMFHGLVYLHQYHLAEYAFHGDLKPTNILLTRNLLVKIASSSTVYSIFTENSNCYTLLYAPPEILQNPTSKKSSAHDIYSMGVILYDVITRHRAFSGVPHFIILQLIQNRGQKPDMKIISRVEGELSRQPDNLAIMNLLKNVMELCWSFDPKDRPDAPTVLNMLNKEFLKVNKQQLALEANSLKEQMSHYLKEEVSKVDKIPLDNFRPWFEKAVHVIGDRPDQLQNQTIFPADQQTEAPLPSSATTVTEIDLEDLSLPKHSSSDFMTSRDESYLLGRGGFGTVVRCELSHLGSVAAKCFNFSDVGKDLNSFIMDGFLHEVEVLRRLHHKHIVKVHGLTSWSSYAAIVMELAARGNLYDLILSKNIKVLPWELRLRILQQVASALNYLHHYDSEITIIHGDVKTANVLLNQNFEPKLTDFGSATIFSATDGVLSSSKQFTLLYSAPEFLLSPDKSKTTKMDVYSFSILGYEVITRRLAFFAEAKPNHVIAAQIKATGLKPESKHLHEIDDALTSQAVDRHIFHVLKDVVEVCWNTNPHERPDITSVYNWLTAELDNVDQSKIERQIQMLSRGLDVTRDQQKHVKMLPLDEWRPQMPTTTDVHDSDDGGETNTGDADFVTAEGTLSQPSVFSRKFDTVTQKSQLNILLVGDEGVGKSLCAARLCGIDGDTTASKPVLEVKQASVETDMDKSKVDLLIWDLAGSDVSKTVISNLPKFDGLVAVYDITNAKSFNNIPYWLRLTGNLFDEQMFGLLLGNKCDLEDERMIKEEEGEELAQLNGLQFFETSAKEAIKINFALIQLVSKISLEGASKVGSTSNKSKDIGYGRGIKQPADKPIQNLATTQNFSPLKLPD